MRLNSRTWFAISIALFLAGGWLWHLGDERQRATRERLSPVQGESLPAGRVANTNISAPGPVDPAKPAASSETKPVAKSLRLSNTTEGYGAMVRSDAAVLLRNAVINTTNGVPLNVPASLRAGSDPGSYVVQSRGEAGDRFRGALARAGAAVVAYIPNNAFLVRAGESAVRQLRSEATVQAVLAFEPYFKLDAALLKLATQDGALPGGTSLNVLVFADEGKQTLESIERMGGRVESSERSPFGLLARITPTTSDWVALARMPGVQALEVGRARVKVNDLARVQLGIAANATTNENYLGLTGKGVLVGINDTGVDAGHPDLAGRVVTTDTNNLALIDGDGHGTHVAGIIGGSGAQSATVTNAPGSEPKASFRGKAHQASLFALYFGSRGSGLSVLPTVKDTYLQEAAARTNVFVSNNSWAYVGANDYETAAASYDAAVRDSLPEATGSQPLLYVFAAGNEGEGDENGVGGVPSSIQAPSTAKNVITVGAVESLRRITNSILVTNINGTNIVISTNQVFFRESDSVDEIANYSSRGNVGVQIEGEFGRMKPDVVAPGSYVISARSRQYQASTNGPYYKAFEAMNKPLAPHYIYETGTSMAAPAVTGLIALMQEFFEQRLARTNSPALMKALLINGARSLGKKYDLSPQGLIGYQGWGQASLTNAIPAFYMGFAGKPNPPGVIGAPDVQPVPHVFLDQGSELLSEANALGGIGHALSTGQSESFDIKPTEEGRVLPMRVTLVWTDPPGNPTAGVKLVNDLNLVVSNTITHEVFLGNNIPVGSDFNQAGNTNSPGRADVVNNVENVFLPPPLGEHYVVSVVARRVNVNAVNANTNAIVQDYALVASVGDGAVTNAFTFARATPVLASAPPALLSVTNGVALFSQRVGANFPLTNGANGDLSQWNFYIFTNVFQSNSLSGLTNGSNVAFVTFFPPNLGRPRQSEADIDLYVSTNPALTNLDAAVLASASKSTNRGGTQVVFFTNAPIGAVYYVGVKAEDQQGSEFGLYGISSEEPFTSTEPDGSQTLRGFPINSKIPDGSPEKPGASVVIAIGTEPIVIRRARVQNIVEHESIGDLTGILSHGDRFAVLNNHFSFADPTITNHFFFYDDSGSGDFRSGARPTDGPGSLNDFIGEEGTGVWLLNMIDNSPSHEGRNVRLTIFLEPIPGALSGGERSGTVLANQWDRFALEIPVDAVSFTVNVAQMSGPIDVYARHRFFPTLTEYDKAAFLKPPGGALVYGEGDQPPLQPGRYIIGLFNPNAVPVNYRLIVNIERSPRAEVVQLHSPEVGDRPIPDDALVASTVFVGDNRKVVRARAGVRIDHPRAADLVLHLVSPSGTRTLLSENRGGLESGGFGSGEATNMVFAGFAEDTNLVVGPIKYARPPYTTVAVTSTNTISGFEGLEARSYNKGEVIDGWTVEDIFRSTNSATGVITRSLPKVETSLALAPRGTNYLNLGRSRISRVIPTRPGQQYSLRFLYRAATSGTINAQVLVDGFLTGFISAARDRWQTRFVDFIAAKSSTEIELLPALNNPGMLLDGFESVETSGSIYYLPEESLKTLEGESAFGTWTLEVLDNRAGPLPASPAPRLLSWQLQLVLTRPGFPVTPLEDSKVVSGVVAGSETRYFSVEVPRDAVVATNLVASTGDLVLLYNPNGLPSGLLADDVVVDNSVSGFEFLTLNTNSVPLLKPGQRYYLGVANFNTDETNSFDIGVFFGYGPSSLIPPLLLTNGVARNATLQATNAVDYYQFNVSPNAYNTTFEVIPSDGNVDMVIRKGLPVRNPLPTPSLYDYSSGEPGTAREEVIVVTNSVPVPLTPGPWFIGVYNVDSNRVSYSVRVTEALSPFTIIPLTNGVPLRSSSARTTVLTNYYSFTVPPPATDVSVRFDLYDLSANADFLLKRDDIFELDKFEIRTNAAPNGTAAFTYSSGPFYNVAGNWFLAVANSAASNVTFTIRATILTNDAPSIRTLTNGVAVTNFLFGSGVESRLEYYRFNVSSKAKFVDFELGSISGEADLLLTKGPVLPLTNRFDYASSNPPFEQEKIRVARGSSPVSLTPGEWHLAAYNRSEFPATYWIRATETIEGKVKPIISDVSYSEFAAVGTLDYYQINTTTNHFTALLQISSAQGNSGQLAMYLRKGLPLPSLADYHYVSTPGSGVSAILSLSRTSSPVPLDGGEWFLAVENKGPDPIPYNLSYTLYTGTQISTNGIAFELVDSPTTVCLRWRSTAGVSYLVQGMTNRSSAVWDVISPPLVATGIALEHCLTKPVPYVDYRIVEAASIPSGTNLVITSSVVLKSDSFCMSWGSVAGRVYRVEGKEDLFAAGWNPVSPPISATGDPTTYCIPLTNSNRFFRVVSP